VVKVSKQRPDNNCGSSAAAEVIAIVSFYYNEQPTLAGTIVRSSIEIGRPYEIGAAFIEKNWIKNVLWKNQSVGSLGANVNADIMPWNFEAIGTFGLLTDAISCFIFSTKTINSRLILCCSTNA
jgi:hypothetical protein